MAVARTRPSPRTRCRRCGGGPDGRRGPCSITGGALSGGGTSATIRTPIRSVSSALKVEHAPSCRPASSSSGCRPLYDGRAVPTGGGPATVWSVGRVTVTSRSGALSIGAPIHRQPWSRRCSTGPFWGPTRSAAAVASFFTGAAMSWWRIRSGFHPSCHGAGGSLGTSLGSSLPTGGDAARGAAPSKARCPRAAFSARTGTGSSKVGSVYL